MQCVCVCVWLLIVFQVTFYSSLLHYPLPPLPTRLPGLKETKVYVWNKKEITIMTEY